MLSEAEILELKDGINLELELLGLKLQLAGDNPDYRDVMYAAMSAGMLAMADTILEVPVS